MSYLTLIVDENNVSEWQYEQALKIVTLYIEEQDRQNEKLELLTQKAQEVNDYQKEYKFANEVEVFNPKPKATPKLKVKKLVKPELDKDGKISHFNLHLVFSQQFITLLEQYFKEYKLYNLDTVKVSKEELRDINILKFNRITNFKPYHVVTLVKFLNENKIPCSHRVEGKNKLVSN